MLFFHAGSLTTRARAQAKQIHGSCADNSREKKTFSCVSNEEEEEEEKSVNPIQGAALLESLPCRKRQQFCNNSSSSSSILILSPLMILARKMLWERRNNNLPLTLSLCMLMWDEAGYKPESRSSL